MREAELAVEQELLLFTSLLTLFSPPAAVAPFVAITGRFTPDIQRRMAARIAAYYGVTLLGAALIGRPVLSVLGISLPALQLTGGLILLLAALPMALKPEHYVKEGVRDAWSREGTAWITLAAVPFTFPITVGGATLATMVTAGSAARGPWALARLLSVCIAMTVVVWLTFRFAPLLGRRLGEAGLSILTAVGGVTLVCIAFQILVPAVHALLAG